MKFACDCFITFSLNLPEVEAKNEEEARKLFEEMIKNEEFNVNVDLDFNGEFDISYITESE